MTTNYWFLLVGRATGLAGLYGFLMLTFGAAIQDLAYADGFGSLAIGQVETASWASAALLFPVILLWRDPLSATSRLAGWPMAAIRAIFGTLWFHHLSAYIAAGVPSLHSENLWWLADPWVFLGFLLLEPTKLLGKQKATKKGDVAPE